MAAVGAAPAASGDRRERTAIAFALLAAGLAVGGHVLGKAARDALYLATFPVERLPYFILATGAVSAVFVAFDVRRRIPRALAACQSPKALGALTRALRDGRFEVRYHAASALERILAHSGRRPNEPSVWAVVREEVKKSRAVWEAQRLLDDDDDDPLADAVGRRGAHSLRHVFRLLGLVLDPKPLELSYRAVLGDDPQFRGVGLEYLENVLPKDIKRALWPLVGDEKEVPPAKPSARSLDRVIEDLEASGAVSRRLPQRHDPRRNER